MYSLSERMSLQLKMSPWQLSRGARYEHLNVSAGVTHMHVHVYMLTGVRPHRIGLVDGACPFCTFVPVSAHLSQLRI